jgi:hypothetical protein
MLVTRRSLVVALGTTGLHLTGTVPMQMEQQSATTMLFHFAPRSGGDHQVVIQMIANKSQTIGIRIQTNMVKSEAQSQSQPPAMQQAYINAIRIYLADKTGKTVLVPGLHESADDPLYTQSEPMHTIGHQIWTLPEYQVASVEETERVQRGIYDRFFHAVVRDDSLDPLSVVVRHRPGMLFDSRLSPELGQLTFGMFGQEQVEKPGCALYGRFQCPTALWSEFHAATAKMWTGVALLPDIHPSQLHVVSSETIITVADLSLDAANAIASQVHVDDLDGLMQSGALVKQTVRVLQAVLTLGTAAVQMTREAVSCTPPVFRALPTSASPASSSDLSTDTDGGIAVLFHTKSIDKWLSQHISDLRSQCIGAAAAVSIRKFTTQQTVLDIARKLLNARASGASDDQQWCPTSLATGQSLSSLRSAFTTVAELKTSISSLRSASSTAVELKTSTLSSSKKRNGEEAEAEDRRPSKRSKTTVASTAIVLSSWRGPKATDKTIKMDMYEYSSFEGDRTRRGYFPLEPVFVSPPPSPSAGAAGAMYKTVLQHMLCRVLIGTFGRMRQGSISTVLPFDKRLFQSCLLPQKAARRVRRALLPGYLLRRLRRLRC